MSAVGAKVFFNSTVWQGLVKYFGNLSLEFNEWIIGFKGFEFGLGIFDSCPAEDSLFPRDLYFNDGHLMHLGSATKKNE